MDHSKKRKRLLSFIMVSALLLVGTLIYSILRDDDQYKYFTGLGEPLDISPDDHQYLFSYYRNGKEAIYQANVNGKNVIRLTNPTTVRHHHPKYSSDGKRILFLAENEKGINSLFVANRDGSNAKQLPTKKLHVSEAVFSPIDDIVYYSGISAKDFHKAEGETKEGYDLYSIRLNSKRSKQLTNNDRFSMNSLSFSSDGKVLYYNSDTATGEKLMAFTLENGEERDALERMKPHDGYSLQLSPNGEKIVYTAIAKESMNSSLYKYELFIMDIKSGKNDRLTNLHANVASARFFHNQNKIAFFEYTNWPDVPGKYVLHTVDPETGKLQRIRLAMPKGGTDHWFIGMLDRLVNGITMAVLYTILVGLLTTYQFLYRTNKRYAPVLISLILAVIVFISSIVVAISVNPWYGIGIGSVAAVMAGCTIIVFIYAFVLNRLGKRR